MERRMKQEDDPRLERNSFGEFEAIDPRRVESGVLRDMYPIQSPIKAIRAFCVECSGNNEAEARRCTAVGCQLWPFRMGSNVFHSRAGKKSDAQT